MPTVSGPLASRAAALLLVAGIAAGCGPSVTDPQAWMLGSFSSEAPGYPASPNLKHYLVHDDGSVEVVDVNSNGPLDETELWEWEPNNERSFSMYSPPRPLAPDRPRTEHRVTRGPACGPHSVQRLNPNDPSTPPPTEIFSGEVCLRWRDCPEDGSATPDGCGELEAYWCDGPPPGCEGPP